MRLGSRNGAVTGDWSKTGGAGEPQPDNREFKVRYQFFLFKIVSIHNFLSRLKESMMKPVLLCSIIFMLMEL